MQLKTEQLPSHHLSLHFIIHFEIITFPDDFNPDTSKELSLEEMTEIDSMPSEDAEASVLIILIMNSYTHSLHPFLRDIKSASDAVLAEAAFPTGHTS